MKDRIMAKKRVCTDLFGIANPESEMMKLDKPSFCMLKEQKEELVLQTKNNSHILLQFYDSI